MGRIQRQIRRAFIAHPRRLFRTVELIAWCYPRARVPERKHREAIYRASKTVARRVAGGRKVGLIFGAKSSCDLPSAG